MCSLRDAATDLQRVKARVLGISTDSVSAQAAFRKQHSLGYALLSDPDASVVQRYGVAWKGRPFARRVTFLIDERGVLRHVVRDVDVRNHGRDVAALIEKLRG